MKRSLFSAALVAIFGVGFSPAGRADDLQAMAGRWTVEAAEAGGNAVDSEELKSLVVTIEGDRYSLQSKDGPDGGTMKLDETKSPKTMDAADTEGDNIGKLIQAIYEITGDTMRVCYALDGSARPTEFATKEGSPWLLVTYRREK
jgi:uncharacterized protein (TIGR03067 family)